MFSFKRPFPQNVKCTTLFNQHFLSRPIFIDSNRPNELCCYPLIVSLDKCDQSYNTLDDLSGRICVPNQT